MKVSGTVRWPWYAIGAVSMIAVVLLTGCGSSAQFEDNSKIAEKIRQTKAATPLPPGAAWDDQSLQYKPGASYQIGYFENMVQAQAQCKWYGYWLSGFANHDQHKMQMAEALFPKMHTWNRYTSADVSFRNLVDAIEAKALLGDPSGLQNFVKLNCAGGAQ